MKVPPLTVNEPPTDTVLVANVRAPLLSKSEPVKVTLLSRIVYVPPPVNVTDDKSEPLASRLALPAVLMMTRPPLWVTVPLLFSKPPLSANVPVGNVTEPAVLMKAPADVACVSLIVYVPVPVK